MHQQVIVKPKDDDAVGTIQPPASTRAADSGSGELPKGADFGW